MLEALSLPAINRLLRSNTWALDRLGRHSGKTALFACPPFELRVTVSDRGEFLAAVADAVPDVAIGMTPGLLLRVAMRDEAAWSTAQVTGDVEFAASIDYVRRNLRWDYEEDLSRVVGDIAAHRLAGATRQLDRWMRDTAMNLTRGLAEYATYETPLLVSAHAIEAFNREVDALRDDTERLEKRLELLRRRYTESA
jgi:ubiquinone biosynthesis protein UbiJ